MSIDIEKAAKKLRKFYIKQRRSPSYQEIATLFGYASKNAAFKLIDKLLKKGLLEKDHAGKIIPKNLFQLPNLGRVRAGIPGLADTIPDAHIDLYKYFVTMSNGTFALTVQGDSMKDAGIHEGDIVIIDTNRRFEVGDIIVARIDHEWTVKYIEKKNGDFCLVPANPEYPIIYPQENLEIGGVVISVIRTYR